MPDRCSQRLPEEGWPPPQEAQRRAASRTPAPLRILLVSAGMGAGHHAVADELVRRIAGAGHDAARIDLLELGRPGQGRRLARTYRFLLRRLPWVYDLAMRFWARRPGPLERLTAWGGRGFERGLLEAVARFEPDVVVSLYNLASQALGRLRAAGALSSPVVTYVTDPGAHPYWVHPAVDLHLALLPGTAEALRSYGAHRTVVVPPVIPLRLERQPPARDEARRRLGLPARALVPLVSAGSWAAGGVEGTVDLLAAQRGVVPMTLCGRNSRLRQRLSRGGRGLALGWTDDMATVMAAADVLVDNAGGLTCWEALDQGLPVVIFRPLPGHGRLNAESLQSAGLAAYARTEAELWSLLHSLPPRRPSDRTAARPEPPGARSAVACILGLSAALGRDTAA